MQTIRGILRAIDPYAPREFPMRIAPPPCKHKKVEEVERNLYETGNACGGICGLIFAGMMIAIVGEKGLKVFYGSFSYSIDPFYQDSKDMK